MIEQIALSTISAIAYSIVFYAKKRSGKSPQAWNPFKFAATVLVGAMVGAMFAYSGVEVTQTAIETQLAAYAGSVAIIESAIKFVWRNILKKRMQ